MVVCIRVPKQAFKRISVLAIPVLCLLVFLFGDSKESRCAYAMAIVVFFWVNETIPLAATALLPVILFPLLDVMGTASVCKSYMKTTTMIALGGLLLAVAIENTNIHKRLALKILLSVGINNKRLMPSFLVTSAFLSMWISNTTTALILVPILEAVTSEIVEDHPTQSESANVLIALQNSGAPNSNEESINSTGPHREEKNQSTPLKKALLLAVAYGANVGGIATLTGTGPNLVLKGVMEDLYEDSEDITYASWMVFGVPCAFTCTVLAWLVLHFHYIKKCPDVVTVNGQSIVEIVLAKYEELGPMRFPEASVLGVFILLKILWFFEHPRFMTGWADLLVKDVKLSGATVVIAMTSLLFIIPSDPKKFWSSPAILDWKSSQKRMQWSIVVILGGGFALADAFKSSGLSRVASQALSITSALPGPAIILIMCFLTATTTEFTSNVVTASVFLPVMTELSVSLGKHPLYLAFPVTIACSFAFMLPIATPPNLIVCEVGNIGPRDMFLPGLLMNTLCCIVTVSLTLSLGAYFFNLNSEPEWLQIKMLNTTLNK